MALSRRALPSAFSLPRSPSSAFPSALAPQPPARCHLHAGPASPAPAARPSLPRAGGSRLPAAPPPCSAGRGSPWPRGSRAVRTSPLLLPLSFRICGLNKPFPALRAAVFRLGIVSGGWGRGAGGCLGRHLRRGHLPWERDRAGIDPRGGVFSRCR